MYPDIKRPPSHPHLKIFVIIWMDIILFPCFCVTVVILSVMVKFFRYLEKPRGRRCCRGCTGNCAQVLYVLGILYVLGAGRGRTYPDVDIRDRDANAECSKSNLVRPAYTNSEHGQNANALRCSLYHNLHYSGMICPPSHSE